MVKKKAMIMYVRLSRQGYRKYLRNYFLQSRQALRQLILGQNRVSLPTLMQDILGMIVAANGKVVVFVRSREMGRPHVTKAA